MRVRGAWAAAISTALVSATLVGIGTAAAVAPAAEAVTKTASVTFPSCELRDQDDERVGDRFPWTTALTLTVETPVSARDLNHVVRLDVGTPIDWPGDVLQLDTVRVTKTFRFAAGDDTGTVQSVRTSDTASFGPQLAIGELEDTSHVYGRSGFKAWKPRSLEVKITGNAAGTTDFRSYTLSCDPLRNAPTVVTAAVYDETKAARINLLRPNGHSITSAAQGTRVRFVGQDFEPLGTVALRLGKHRVATARADVTGAIVGTFRVPPTLKARAWRLDAVGSSALKSAEHKHLYVVHPKVRVTAPARRPAGARVKVVGAKFVAQERVRVQLRVYGKRTVRATTVVRATKAGRVTAQLRTRPALRGNYYEIVLTGLASGRSATKSIYLR